MRRCRRTSRGPLLTLFFRLLGMAYHLFLAWRAAVPAPAGGIQRAGPSRRLGAAPPAPLSSGLMPPRLSVIWVSRNQGAPRGLCRNCTIGRIHAGPRCHWSQQCSLWECTPCCIRAGTDLRECRNLFEWSRAWLQSGDLPVLETCRLQAQPLRPLDVQGLPCRLPNRL